MASAPVADAEGVLQDHSIFNGPIAEWEIGQEGPGPDQVGEAEGVMQDHSIFNVPIAEWEIGYESPGSDQEVDQDQQAEQDGDPGDNEEEVIAGWIDFFQEPANNEVPDFFIEER
eukprot:9751031-Heterocapsa_arctica.AAC.1